MVIPRPSCGKLYAVGIVLGCVFLVSVTPMLFAASLPQNQTGTQEKESQPVVLEPGKLLERTPQGGEKNPYEHVDSGLFVHVVVEQLGIDVVLTLYAPDGKQIASMDSPNGASGLEQISTIAEASGVYRLDVVPWAKNAPAGRYRVMLHSLRVPDDKDRSRIAAEHAFYEAEMLLQKGSADSLRSAAQRYLEVASLWRSVGDAYEEALTLQIIGTIYSHFGEKRKALDYYNQAMPLMRAVGIRAGEMQQEPARYYTDVKLLLAVGDRYNAAITLNNIGFVYRALGEKRKALDYYDQALSLWRELSKHSEDPGALNEIGRVNDYEQQHEYEQQLAVEQPMLQKPLDYYNQALPLERAVEASLRARPQEARTLHNIGEVYDDLGERQNALNYYKQAVLLWRDAGDRLGEAMTLTNLGNLYGASGENQKAVEYFNRALKMERAERDRPDEARTLIALGKVCGGSGEKQKALEFFERALALERAEREMNNPGARASEARSLNLIGLVYADLGEQQKALDYYNQALLLRYAIGDRSGEAITLSDIGVVYAVLGEQQKALDYYNQALLLAREVGDRSLGAIGLNNIGGAYDVLGEKQKALDYYNQALLLESAFGDRSGETITLSGIGVVYAALGEQQKALDYYNQALPLARAVGNRSFEAAILNNIGLAYKNLGERQKALDHYNQSLPLACVSRDRPGEAMALGNLLGLFNDSDPNLAIAFGKEAVNLLQSIRRDNRGLQDSLRARYEKAIEGYYRSVANLLIARERFGEAEEVLNLLKDKEASDFIRHDSVSDQLRSATLLDSEKKALDRYDQIVNQIVDLGQRKAALVAKSGQAPLSSAELQQENRLDQDLSAANTVLQRFFEEERRALAVNSAKAGRLEDFKEAEGLQDALQKLGPDVVAIYTLVLPDKYVAMLITSGARKVYTSPIKETELNRKIFEFRQRLQNPASDPLPLAQELYHIVFPEGLRQDLDTMHAKTLMWSIDSTLRYIPFGTIAQRLGAKGVIASLWSVSDESTASLMQTMYAPRQQSPGMTKDEALREAQLALLTGQIKPTPAQDPPDRGAAANRPKSTVKTPTDWSHPYYWAPFILIGNWK